MRLAPPWESAGVEFIDENGGGAGVRLKKSSETVAAHGQD